MIGINWGFFATFSGASHAVLMDKMESRGLIELQLVKGVPRLCGRMFTRLF